MTSAEVTVEFAPLANQQWRWWVHSTVFPSLNGSDTSATLTTAATDAAQWIATNDQP